MFYSKFNYEIIRTKRGKNIAFGENIWQNYERKEEKFSSIIISVLENTFLGKDLK
jgi:hypothetical protein